MKKSNWLALFAAGSAAIVLASAAQADVKIKSLLSISSATPSTKMTPSVQSVTICYKGNDARVEPMGPDGSTLLFKGEEGNVYSLDTVKKTYFVRSVKDLSAPQDPTGKGAEKTDITLSEGKETRRFAGMAARVYHLAGIVPDSLEINKKRLPGEVSRKLSVSGEYWLSQDLALPSDLETSVFPTLITSNPGEDRVFRALADYFNTKAELSKDIPLNSQITLTETTPQGTQESVTLTTEVIAISQTILPESLFELPADYKQVPPPPYSLRL